MKFIACLAPFVVCSAFAQSASITIKATAVKPIVDHLIVGLNDYVFPDRASTLQAYLRGHLGDYAQIRSPQALADRLTADLQSVGHDKHLMILYTPPASRVDPLVLVDETQRHDQDEARGFGVKEVARLPGNIGYLRLDYFTSDPESISIASSSMTLLHGSDALILDLRNNGGGNPFMLDQLLSYFFSKRTQLTSIVWHEDGKTHEDQQWTSVYVPGLRFLDKPIYVLTSADTFSAGEQCAYDLKTLKRATLVGETTGGGANPANKDHPLGLGFDAFIPNGQAENPITHTNWEGTGVVPDIPVKASEALLTAYVQALKTVKPEVTGPTLQKVYDNALKNPQKTLNAAGFGSL